MEDGTDSKVEWVYGTFFIAQKGDDAFDVEYWKIRGENYVYSIYSC